MDQPPQSNIAAEKSAAANPSLEDHKHFIIGLYHDKLPEEKIAELLDTEKGVEASLFDVHDHLEKWHIIPSRSPVCSIDADDAVEPHRNSAVDTLNLSCHHGPTFSHFSPTNLTNIPSDPSAVEKYQTDYQPHEQRAYDLRHQRAHDLGHQREVIFLETESGDLEALFNLDSEGRRAYPNGVVLGHRERQAPRTRVYRRTRLCHRKALRAQKDLTRRSARSNSDGTPSQEST